VTVCVHRLPEVGTPVSKHVGVTIITNCFVMCILLCKFVVVLYIEYQTVQGGRNIEQMNSVRQVV